MRNKFHFCISFKLSHFAVFFPWCNKNSVDRTAHFTVLTVISQQLFPLIL